jgi:hypothetical protein
VSRPEHVTVSAHDKILNALIADAAGIDQDLGTGVQVQTLVVKAYSEGIITGEHGMVDDRDEDPDP